MSLKKLIGRMRQAVRFEAKVEFTKEVIRTDQKIIVPAPGLAKVGGTAGWIVGAADNLSLVTLPAAQTGSKLVIPITGLKKGQTIKSFHLIGQVESGGNNVTLDAELRKHTAAAADVADAQVAAIPQRVLAADTILSAANTSPAAQVAEVVGEDETFYVVVTGTTTAATDVAIQGVAVLLDEA